MEVGYASSPAPLQAGVSDYRFAASYQTLYSTKIETALIKIETDAGITGWGEPQSPVAPEVVCSVVKTILAPILLSEDPMAHVFETGGVGIFQPDIGRTGITEGLKLCALSELHNIPVAFHISIGFGVQVAAALHVAASIPNLIYVECNPIVWQVAETLKHNLKAQGVIKHTTIRPPINGAFPQIAVVAGHENRNEAGIGALLPWADRLWFVAYVAHKRGEGTGLYCLDEKMQMQWII
jgi:hypothetical protein